MILLIGGTGYVGHKFQEVLSDRELEFRNLSRKDFDYYDFNKLSQLLTWNPPKVVINAGGFTGKPNVDQCEVEKSGTITGNVLLPQIIAQACDMNDIPLVHVSSGCIYSGDKGEDASGDKIGFTEKDEPNFSFDKPPCSFYSGTKALGESVLSKFEKVYTCRLRIPFDEFDSNRNYLSKIQRYDKVYNAVNSISHRKEFVDACIDVALKECDYGIYNVTNGGYVTTKQVVELMKEKFELEKEFEYWEDDSEFYSKGATAARSNCVMDNTKLLNTGINMRHCMDAVGESFDKWVKG
jgi:dTDP-4-dehydrorhamnose reductase